MMFSLTLPMLRIAIPAFGPLFSGIGRSSVACIVAAVILLVTRAQLPTFRQFKQLAIICLGTVIGFPLLTAFAMQTVSASYGGVVLGILPLATAAIAVLFGEKKPSQGFWMFAVIGAAVVTLYAASQGLGSLSIADGYLFVAIILTAIGYVKGGQLSTIMPGWWVISWSIIVATPVTIPIAIYAAPSAFMEISWQSWLSFLYLALFSQLIGFFLWNKGLALGGITTVSQIQLLQIFFTIFVSAVLLDEPIGFSTILCAFLVAGCVWFGKKYT